MHLMVIIMLQLDEFIFMPNHIHGIIIINNHDRKTNNYAGLCDAVETQNLASPSTKTTEIPIKSLGLHCPLSSTLNADI